MPPPGDPPTDPPLSRLASSLLATVLATAAVPPALAAPCADAASPRLGSVTADGRPDGQPGRGPHAVRSRQASPLPGRLAPLVSSTAALFGLDPRLLQAIAHVESRHDPGAVSPKGAMGLMQVMPATAARFGVREPRALLDPRVNLYVAGAYLAWLHDRFDDDLVRVLAAYNAGEGAVAAAGGVPAFPETQAYVRRVLERLDLMRAPASCVGNEPDVATRTNVDPVGDDDAFDLVSLIAPRSHPVEGGRP